MKKVVVFPGLLAAALFIAQPALAAGIGVYGTGGVNFTKWESHDLTDGTFDYYYGGGLIIDSNVAKNKIFGYRFTAGYAEYRIKDIESKSLSDPIHRASMSHTFGFGLIRDEDTRFWIGPSIGFHYLRLRESFWALEADSFSLLIYPHRTKVKVDMVGFDALLTLGMNQNIGDIATLFIQIGFGYMGNYSINISEIGHGFGIDGKVGIMFRINDTFKQTSSSGDGIMRVQDIK